MFTVTVGQLFEAELSFETGFSQSAQERIYLPIGDHNVRFIITSMCYKFLGHFGFFKHIFSVLKVFKPPALNILVTHLMVFETEDKRTSFPFAPQPEFAT